MVFWRKKKNQKEQEQDEQDDRLLHHPGEPQIELPTEYEAELDDEIKHELQKSESEIIETLQQTPIVKLSDTAKAEEKEEFADDSAQVGWLFRLTGGLSKSSTKLTRGIADAITKKKLDQETLDNLEDILIEADLGPQTAAKIIENFSKDRFGQDVDENDINEALAAQMTEILKPVAKPLIITKPESGPYVILVCGVNGAGKTTSIGKLASQLHHGQGLKVAMAAGDTFRAAAVEQLSEWAARTDSLFISKDIGADSASVAYELYEKAVQEDVDVLLIDTAGRLQNKKNLMAELEKIVRVLKKKNETLPHATILVLDATTGQNAYSQLETFKDMVNITGLIVTKLDGSAKGGVLIGLADRFGVPVHAIGVGESVEDMQAFSAEGYAKSLTGLSS